MLREPLVQFLVAGSLLFAGYSYFGLDSMYPDKAEPVRIGAGEMRWLEQTFSSQQGRAPTTQELRDLVETLIEEELLAREARAMRLDEGDTIIRRRLAQKLSFVREDTQSTADATEVDLRNFHAVHADQFRSEPRLSFAQIFFDPARRQDVERDAKAALIRISGSDDDSTSIGMGDALLLEDSYAELDQTALSNLFGADFAAAVFGQAVGEWAGPIRSGYGLHLVQVTSREPAQLRPFEQVRSEVAEAWRIQRASDARSAYLAELRQKYGVDIDQELRASAILRDLGVTAK